MTDEKPPLCTKCRDPKCMVKVEPGWPEKAREAYADAGYAWAATCGKGQAQDLLRTEGYGSLGWCWDRVVRHPDYRPAREPEPVP